MKDSNGWEFFPTYSTREAVDDGFLVKIDLNTSKEVGIKFPVCQISTVW
jgi:type I site-specific restriction endonuclease